MRVSGEIEVERINAEGDSEMILITLEGHAEYFGSYNPHERGLQVADWGAYGPDGKKFTLTPSETDCADEILEANLRDE